MELDTIEQVLDFAIASEVRAAAVYRGLAAVTARKDLRKLLLEMAAQEEDHREALEHVREGDLTMFAKQAPPDELWALSTVPSTESISDPSAALLFAIDSEQRAFQLYATLALATDDPGLKTLLDALARQEACHWHDLQTAYETLTAPGPDDRDVVNSPSLLDSELSG